MNIYKLSFRNIIAKPLNSFLNLLMIGLSVALISFSFHLKDFFSEKLNKSTGSIDMVIGAKGSPLQLILSSVLHIDAPTGNIDYKEALKVARNPLIEKAIPLSYGDNYKGYRIVGSTPDIKGLYNAELDSGSDIKNSMEVVFGAVAASNLNIKTGDSIVSSHGLLDNDLNNEHEDEKIKVVGVLKTTHTVLDNLILTSLETIWELHEHEEHHDDTHDEEKEITALLVKFRNPMAMVQLPRRINENTNMQAALTTYELQRLFNLTGVGLKAISMIAVAILVLSVFSIFISLYRLVKERRYELALMRVYGAGNVQLLLVVLLESFLLGMTGFLAGILFSRIGLVLLNNYMTKEFRYHTKIDVFLWEEIYLLVLILFLMGVATLIAAAPIFKMNISKILTDEE